MTEEQKTTTTFKLYDIDNYEYPLIIIKKGFEENFKRFLEFYR